MVNFAYAAVLNATEQTLFCCGLVRSLSPQVGIDCVSSVVCCSYINLQISSSLFTMFRIISLDVKSRLDFKYYFLTMLLADTRITTGSSVSMNSLLYGWKLRKEEA